jgi:hypothetical protein
MKEEQRRHNRRLAKKRVQCLNEALCFVSSSVLADSLVLRNPLLRQAPKRYAQGLATDSPHQIGITSSIKTRILSARRLRTIFRKFEP